MINFLLFIKYYNLKLNFIIKSELIFLNFISKFKICLKILKDNIFIKYYNFLNNIELKAQKLHKKLKLKSNYNKILKIIRNYWEIINKRIIKPYKIIVVIINLILLIKYFYLNRDLNILILIEKIFIENNLNQYLDKVLNFISYNFSLKNIINIIITNYNYLYEKYLFIINYLIWLLLFLNNLILIFL
uniref:Orf187 n=1 Tax=Flammulina velutipes TaxID=38945 RepID=A0A0A0MZ92_FLAVE|nr:orf187 [Flammulina velutipes]